MLPRGARAITAAGQAASGPTEETDVVARVADERVAGIIAAAVGDDLLIAHPAQTLHGVALAVVVGARVLSFLGESLFRMRMPGTLNAKRLAVAGLLVLLAPIGAAVSALALSATVAAVLSATAVSALALTATVAAVLCALALWELGTPGSGPLRTRLGSSTDAPVAAVGDLRSIEQQQEGTS
ncbi:MAG TPA: low temperature requirement protein A [Conexibacter sp.]